MPRSRIIAARKGIRHPQAPAAHAATAPKSDGCSAGIAAAQNAAAAYNAAVASLKQQVANGGNPGTAEQDNVTALLNAANAAVSSAKGTCASIGVANPSGLPNLGGAVTPSVVVNPSAVVHAGVGSTSQGTEAVDIALGSVLVAAAGLGVVAARRRRTPGVQL